MHGPRAEQRGSAASWSALRAQRRRAGREALEGRLAKAYGISLNLEADLQAERAAWADDEVRQRIVVVIEESMLKGIEVTEC